MKNMELFAKILKGISFITLSIIMILYSCKDEIRIHYKAPEMIKEFKYVHNSCTGKWALQTGYTQYYQNTKKDTTWKEMHYFGTRYYMYFNHEDTSDMALIGFEFQFNDTISAKYAYTHWSDTPDSITIRQHIKDSTDRVEDSLFKCQHTYK